MVMMVVMVMVMVVVVEKLQIDELVIESTLNPLYVQLPNFISQS